MDLWQITHDEIIHATHEIGNLVIAEQFGIDWAYVTLDHHETDKRGCLCTMNLSRTQKMLSGLY